MVSVGAPRPRRWLAAAFAALALPALLTQGCAQAAPLASDCWTRERVAAAAAAPVALRGIRLGAWQGEEVEPDASNWWTGVRFTGRACRARIYEGAEGRFFAAVSFLPAPVQLTIAMTARDFYIGRVNADSVLVVQQHPRGLSATHTGFDDAGALNYGACAPNGLFFLECHANSAE